MKIAVSRPPGAHRVVTPLELFFDLVYVFAIGQLSHHLLAHMDLRTGIETTILTLAVVYAWVMVTWGANWLDPDRLPVKGFLIALMFASTLMSAGIADAFADRAWLFVLGYLLLQLGRSAFLIWALRGRALGEHFVNDLVWEIAVGGLWIAGAIAHGDARLALWAAAVGAGYLGLATLHWLPGRGRRIDLQHTDISAEHLVERFRLFIIIALGETVLVTSREFSDQPFNAQRLAALVVGFAGTVALWWCYFHRMEALAVHAAESADDAGAVGWQGTWAMTAVIGGFIAIAVGDELAIAHPDYQAYTGFTLLVFGGPALILLAQALFLHHAVGWVSRARLAGVGALAVLAVATKPFNLLVGISAAGAVLIAVAIADTVSRAPQPSQEHV
jgi:low temperature requirement protein LtrA